MSNDYPKDKGTVLLRRPQRLAQAGLFLRHELLALSRAEEGEQQGQRGGDSEDATHRQHSGCVRGREGADDEQGHGNATRLPKMEKNMW
jgi:hypothetical protein